MNFAVIIIIAVYFADFVSARARRTNVPPIGHHRVRGLAGSLILAMTMIPIWFVCLPQRIPLGRVRKQEHGWMAALNDGYARGLERAMDRPWATVSGRGDYIGRGAQLPFLYWHRVHARNLDEGSILVETRSCRHFSDRFVEISKRIEQRLRTFPEISDVVVRWPPGFCQPKRWESTKATHIYWLSH